VLRVGDNDGFDIGAFGGGHAVKGFDTLIQVNLFDPGMDIDIRPLHEDESLLQFLALGRIGSKDLLL
jgi:hypothetical protein